MITYRSEIFPSWVYFEMFCCLAAALIFLCYSLLIYLSRPKR
ncbi:TPA_asm: hypothetical protein [Porphyromonas phage phage027a_F0568]|uniref:Uncharacterized protein n=2 Tax=Viruses TaxID=10239 RepID=A0AAT9J927_9CAUD